MAGLVERPIRLDPEIDLIAKRGLEHEARYLAGLEAGRAARHADRPGRSRCPGRRAPGPAAAAAADDGAGDPARRRRRSTRPRSSTAGGSGWRTSCSGSSGRAPSGEWSYEVVDTKLARHVKASALLQICSYVEQLTADPGRRAGVDARRPGRQRADGGAAPRRGLHGLLPDGQGRVRGPRRGPTAGTRPRRTRRAATYPEPVEHCDVCRWSLVCQARRRADDDLSLVAGAPTRLRRALKGAGVATRRGLAALELPLPEPLDGVGAAALATARDQAAIQVRGQDAGRTIYELLPPSRLRGRGARAEPRPDEPARAAAGRPLLRHRGRPVRAGRRRRLPVRRSWSRG